MDEENILEMLDDIDDGNKLYKLNIITLLH